MRSSIFAYTSLMSGERWSPTLSIRVTSSLSPESAIASRLHSRKDYRVNRARASIWALAFLSLTAATLALFAVRTHLGEAHVALVFLLVVLGASAAGGRILGMTTALLAFLALDWFCLPPYNSFV